jgi:undecaprenyl-diphosphatase
VIISDGAVAIRRFRWWYAAAAAIFAAMFVAIAAFVAFGHAGPLDLATTIAFQSVASDALDLVANVETVAGQLSVTLALALVLAFVAWRRVSPAAALGPLLILATGPVELLFKSIMQQPGPPHEFVRAFHNVLGVRIDTPASFPSGHVTRLTFLVLLGAAMFPRGWMPAAAALAITAIVYLRVYIGDHWISDALAGVCLGAAFAALAVGWMRAAARR